MPKGGSGSYDTQSGVDPKSAAFGGKSKGGGGSKAKHPGRSSGKMPTRSGKY